MPPDPALRRDIGLTGSAFLAFNGIVGAGIFALPGPLHAQFGAFAPWLFPLFGLLILTIAIPLARLAVLFPGTGGPVAYTAPFGPAVSFQVGWLYNVARIASVAANATVFATYAGGLWAPLGTWAGRAALITALIGALTFVNVIGVRRAIRALDLLTLLKALPLLGLAIWGLSHAAGGLPPPGPLPPLSALEASALVLLYAFVGFENAAVPAEETADPARNIPRALILTIAATALLYFLVQLGYAAIMPPGAQPAAPVAAYAEALIGPAGATLLALTAMVSIAGNLGGALIAAPRVTYAMAMQGTLPAWFGRIDPRFATPANAILFMAALALILALTGSFVWLAIVSTIARLIAYAASLAALPQVQRGASGWALAAPGLGVCAYAAVQSSWESWAMLAAFALAGLLLYLLARRQAGASAATAAPTGNAAAEAAATDNVSSIHPPPSTRSPS